MAANKQDNEEGYKKATYNYVPLNELQDPIAILFRKILKACNVNVSKWATLVNSHLKWEVTETDPQKAKKMRGHQVGNIKSTFFESYNLTFQKLLTGLSILRVKKCEIIIRITDHEDKVTEVSEQIKIASSFDKKKAKDEKQ